MNMQILFTLVVENFVINKKKEKHSPNSYFSIYLNIPGRPLEFRDHVWNSGTMFGFRDDLRSSGTTFGIRGRPLELRNDYWKFRDGTTFGIPGRPLEFRDDLWNSGTTFGIPGRHLEFRDDHWKFRDNLWTSGANFGIPGRPLEFRDDLWIPGRVELTHSPQGTRTCDLLYT